MPTRDDGAYTAISQPLSVKMQAGHHFTLTLALRRDPVFFGYRDLSPSTGKVKEYLSTAYLQVWGGTTPCSFDEFLAASPPVDNEDWEVFQLDLTPRKEKINYLIIAVKPYGGVLRFGNAYLYLDDIYLSYHPSKGSAGRTSLEKIKKQGEVRFNNQYLGNLFDEKADFKAILNKYMEYYKPADYIPDVPKKTEFMKNIYWVKKVLSEGREKEIFDAWKAWNQKERLATKDAIALVSHEYNIIKSAENADRNKDLCGDCPPELENTFKGAPERLNSSTDWIPKLEEDLDNYIDFFEAALKVELLRGE